MLGTLLGMRPLGYAAHGTRHGDRGWHAGRFPVGQSMELTMSDLTDQAELRPFVAPCRTVPATAPLRWLRMGWRDVVAAPVQSLGLGTCIALLSAVVTAIAWRYGTGWLVLAMISGFIFVAPVLATGLYAISAALEQGLRPSALTVMATSSRVVGDVLVYTLILMVICLIWIRAGSAVEIFFPQDSTAAAGELLTFLLIGTTVGSCFAVATFAASAFSLPMLVDRKTDAVTAVVTSVHAVLRNWRAMIVWSLLIAASVAIGFATALIGLAVTMPLIGHATWHAYRETIDSDEWPLRERAAP